MKNDVFLKVLSGIESKKLELKRVLTDEETKKLLDNCDRLSFFQRRRLVSTAKSGIGDVNKFYKTFIDYNDELTDEQKEFVCLSMDEIEKQLIFKKLFIDTQSSIFYEVLDSYNQDAIKYAYLRRKFNYPPDGIFDRILEDSDKDNGRSYHIEKKNRGSNEKI